MEKINQLAQENIKTEIEIIDGDTIEISSAVASAVLYVADVPEKRLNFLLESEKKVLDSSDSSIKLDSVGFNEFYDSTFMANIFYSGKLKSEKKSSIGLYIFSPNPYDYLNNEFLFFQKMSVDENNQFSIDANFPLPNRILLYYNLYAVFMDLETEEPIAIERILVD